NKYELPCEYLRVYSPSAEVRGHGPGQEVLQVGKENVNIQNIEQVGNYAIKLQFSDGHDTGIYSWELLYELAHDYAANWQRYLERLTNAGYQRRESAST
ncbi:MAG: gamma-butyrobetaine hydroxylase-like domain-containing protein, partial [Gammaproteobacteria bacterium]|nr:gamma-butyrobetaine hydroxylase-like domain-containing protein [Gammaproteobacteria bacterium]